jgi:hypothetical protein
MDSAEASLLLRLPLIIIKIVTYASIRWTKYNLKMRVNFLQEKNSSSKKNFTGMVGVIILDLSF